MASRGPVKTGSATTVKISDSGVFTAEGNVAGDRAGRLTKKRDEQRAEFEKKRKAITDEHRKASVAKVDDKFNRHVDAQEMKFKSQTVGLVNLDDYIRLSKKRNPEDSKGKKKKKKKKPKIKSSVLSFGDDIDEDILGDIKGTRATQEGTDDTPKKATLKNPNALTDFLPDRERDEKSRELREKYKKEWVTKQEKVKKERLEITYSYWDGSGHRRDIVVPKGATMLKYLEWVRQDLSKEFPELRGVSAESLMYVKEDLIIPHHITFYELILTKARGKSGPLFNFGVHDDVRMLDDHRVEKDESHAGKIVERRWFERNKHIFPASRWEMYDPTINRGAYSIHGAENRGKNQTEEDTLNPLRGVVI